MYKKLHTPEKESSAEPFCDKGSFLMCVPERDIMVTTYVRNLILRIDALLYTVFIILFKIS